MSKRTTNPACTCGCNANKKVLTVTQLENQKVLEPENLENRDKILVLTKNINNAYMVKVMSGLTVKAVVEAIEDADTAFLMVEMKEPAAPVDPGTTDPGTTDPGTTDPGTTDPGTTPEPETPGGTGDAGTDPENPDVGTGEDGKQEGNE